MAKEKRDKNPGGRPRKHAGDPDKQGRTGSPLSIRIDPELRAKVPEFQALFKRQHGVKLDLTDVVEMALVRLYRDHGLLESDPSASVEK